MGRGAPLILGGDLNVRPRDSEIYHELAERFGLASPPPPTRSTTSWPTG